MKLFFTILGVGLVASAIPFGYLGMLFGFTPVLLTATTVSLLVGKGVIKL